MKNTYENQNIVPFVSVSMMVELVNQIGIEEFIVGVSHYIEEDFKRWEQFDKSPRFAAHSPEGVIELMPTSDGVSFGCKYVNGHPKNTREGKQTVIAFGVLSDVSSGYPIMLSEMTLLTALRTAATSTLVAKHLAPKRSNVMAMIGNGSQSEFQALGFKAELGINEIRLFDTDRSATVKCIKNLSNKGLKLIQCASAEEAVQGADIITTCTADKLCATILSDNMVGSGVHINAIGGDCPGKTELHKDILLRSDIFVEYPPQTRIEGEIQQLSKNHKVTEFWKVLTGDESGRTSEGQITLFDGVGFAIEDFSALRYVYDKIRTTNDFESLDLLANPQNPRNLYGLLGGSSAYKELKASA